jgi:nicotinamidase-related amidase
MDMIVERNDCVLLVIDVQGRIIDTIAEHDTIVQNIKVLIKASEALGLPVFVTQQEKLGETVPELKNILTGTPFLKTTFSCSHDAAFMSKLAASRKRTAILCGIETHVCVVQTALDLLKLRYRVLIVRDATSSHAIIDRETALERMKGAGAAITTTEAIIYELTERAGTDEFRRILGIIKEKRMERP